MGIWGSNSAKFSFLPDRKKKVFYDKEKACHIGASHLCRFHRLHFPIMGLCRFLNYFSCLSIKLFVLMVSRECFPVMVKDMDDIRAKNITTAAYL